MLAANNRFTLSSSFLKSFAKNCTRKLYFLYSCTKKLFGTAVAKSSTTPKSCTTPRIYNPQIVKLFDHSNNTKTNENEYLQKTTRPTIVATLARNEKGAKCFMFFIYTKGMSSATKHSSNSCVFIGKSGLYLSVPSSTSPASFCTT